MSVMPTWLRGYDRDWLPADAMAGLTIWALMVPQAMAYAGIAGVPVQNGLYVMPLAVVGYALFGSSRHLFVGPSATVATLSASSVAVVATASTSPAAYIALTCALTLMVGVIYIAGGLRGWASLPASSRARCSRASSSASGSTSRSTNCRSWWASRSRPETRLRCS